MIFQNVSMVVDTSNHKTIYANIKWQNQILNIVLIILIKIKSMCQEWPKIHNGCWSTSNASLVEIYRTNWKCVLNVNHCIARTALFIKITIERLSCQIYKIAATNAYIRLMIFNFRCQNMIIFSSRKNKKNLMIIIIPIKI